MAKRRRVYAAARGYARRGYSRARGGMGGLKGMITPVVAGVADSYLDPMLPIDGIGASAVGIFMHNETVKNIGLYKVGFSLGNVLPLPGRGGAIGTSGGFS